MIPRLPSGFSHPMRIGEGAFASVYRVRQEALERWVALKFIDEKNPLKRRELLKEAQTQAQLRTDSIPQIYDAFEWHGSICMVMEWISGISLTSLLDRELTVDNRLSIATDFVLALCAIHKLGFVHRDLKPENIIITPDRWLYLVDFGFSKNVADMHVSAVAHAKGTPAYMAPELWLKGGGRVDLMRADVFSSGKILRLVLAGTPAVGFTDALLLEDSLKRPASGVAVRTLWEASPWVSNGDAALYEMAGALAAERLSSDLLFAAKQLLHARREEEAYWLLVESIEKNGNNREAMEIMGNFKQRTHKRWSAVHYAVLSMAIVGGLLTAFFAGKRSMEVAAHEPIPIRRHYTPMLASIGNNRSPIGNAELREDPHRSDRLSGKLLLRNMPHAPVIRIDGCVIDSDSAYGNGLPLHWGEHDLSVCDSSGRVYRQESIALLPFQTKSVDLSMPSPVMKGTEP